MFVKDNKLFIFVNDSDAVKNNKISFSKNSDTETTNYCPPESKEQNKLFKEFLGDTETFTKTPIILDDKKFKKYKNVVRSRVVAKYSALFRGRMVDFETVCNEIISSTSKLVANGMVMTGSRPYLNFNWTELGKKLKNTFYGEITTIIVEKQEDKFIIYPEFHPMFAKIEEIVDFNQKNNMSLYPKYYGIKMNEDESFINKSYIYIPYPELGDLSNINKNELEILFSKLFHLDEIDKENNINQIWLFKNELKIGDYICWIKENIFHLGKITSEYIFKETSNTSGIHTREVKWVNKNIDLSIISQILNNNYLLNSSFFFKLDIYQDIIDLMLNNSFLLNNNQEIESINTNFLDTCTRKGVGKNIILYGVPGSGKSWTIKNKYCNDDSKMERLVFYPDYSYTDFVGQILPKVSNDFGVTYEFTPGPFTNLLKKAYLNPNEEYFLVIEELNRGNAQAIFGDIFLLLDRTKDGFSEYNITNKDIAKIVYQDENHKVSIPSNMNILATMNTSDQNVFTLDTAFQRRWEMKLIPNKFNNNNNLKNIKILDTNITWDDFIKKINEIILSKSLNTNSSEDKRLGVYFINEDDLKLNANNDKNGKFAEKVLKYLWDDVFKFNKDDIFDLDIAKSLEDVIEIFENKKGDERFKIFKNNLF
ncbi:AAA family ATPase [Mesomycoplasma hyorhinis]|nr:AAA family ATPase [Mesomycoplasma hyorhinis]